FRSLTAAGLSFLGLGVQGLPEWGSMLSDGRFFMQKAPLLMVYPGLSIMLTVLGFNFLGDGLRDVLDPKDGGLSDDL
ncbi:MAG: nickel ABC transporter permease subunit NikC, partial [Methanosarcinaceae archaeon]|nr:nickel ABC transporter permease subunit NikC [Methanosarcinaceae archaeon]